MKEASFDYLCRVGFPKAVVCLQKVSGKARHDEFAPHMSFLAACACSIGFVALGRQNGLDSA